MSDYVRNKQVLYPVTKELLRKLNCNDIYDLEDDFEKRLPAESNFTAEVFIDCGECHILGDLVLVYKKEGREIELLTLMRLGNHNEILEEVEL